MVPDPSRTSLGLEYFVQEGDELWSSADGALVELGRRECSKLGLVEERADAVVAQEVLQAVVPPAEMYALHMHLIRHGREVCVARGPYCSQCVLSSLCPRIGVVAAR